MVLQESIQGLEGIPRKTRMRPEFEVWLKSIDHTQRTKVIRRLMGIHKFGKYGKNSHDLFSACKGLYEIVFQDSLRVYFTVEDPDIILEDGSHSKSGGKTTGSQQRAIDRVVKRLKEAQYFVFNKQWFEDFVTPTQLLMSFCEFNQDFEDMSDDENMEIMVDIASIVASRTGETVQQILEDL